VCAAPVFDFGSRDNGADVEHTFVLRNAGTAPLLIGQVRTTCGCATTRLSTNALPPGASADLAVRLTLPNYLGAKRAAIYIQSNDPDQPQFSCRLQGTATTELDINPRQVKLTATPETIPAEQAVTLMNRSDIPLLITQTLSRLPSLTVRVVTNAPGRAYAVWVGCASNLQAQATLGEVVLHTDHPRYSRVAIPVSLAIHAELAVSPAALEYTVGSNAAPRSASLLVRSLNGKPFKIAGVESSLPDALPIRILRATALWARLEVGPFIPSPALNGARIRIRTDMLGFENIEIPVRIISGGR
jgi:hypothetical protein